MHAVVLEKLVKLRQWKEFIQWRVVALKHYFKTCCEARVFVRLSSLHTGFRCMEFILTILEGLNLTLIYACGIQCLVNNN